MADQKRWFKFWCTAPGDDHLQALPVCDRWAWVAFGAYTKAHGTRGRIIVSASNATLAAEMGVPVRALFDTLKRLPHVQCEEGKPDNGKLTVTWNNWQQYQEDSTVAERVSRLRSKRRREEKRRELLPSSSSPSSFDAFWQAYPKKEGKGAARKAWNRVRPTAELLATMLAAIEAQKRGEQWGESHGQFIPHPATWLNQERWKDEPYRGLWPK